MAPLSYHEKRGPEICLAAAKGDLNTVKRLILKGGEKVVDSCGKWTETEGNMADMKSLGIGARTLLLLRQFGTASFQSSNI